MKLIDTSFELIRPIADDEWITEAKIIERAARTCYRSDDRITDDSYDKMIRFLIRKGHMSPIEHGYATIRLTVSRAIQQELTRHRLASYSVESTRYVNYGNRELQFVVNNGQSTIDPQYWAALETIEQTYVGMVNRGVKPEVARDVLPLSLASQVVMSCNFREWLHIFKLRCSPAAHPDIRLIMTLVRDTFANKLPCIFGDTNEQS
jgi:thymidylate synthase (FAD)